MSGVVLHALSVSFFVLALAVFLGFEVISKVPTTLHTPLMSGSNAISGVILIGALMVAATTQDNTPALYIALAAVFLGAINVAGGFVVTDRMLGMFSSKKKKKG